MINISDIESGILCTLESVGRAPHYAFVSSNSLHNLFKRANHEDFYTAKHSLAAFGLYTSVGLVMLYSMSCLRDDELIFSQESNLLVDFMNKLEIRP